MMAADGEVPFPLSPYIDAHKEDYLAALKAAQQKLDWPAMVGFMSRAISATVAEATATENALASLQRSWRSQSSFRTNSAAALALGVLPEYPVVTVARLSKLLGVSAPAANAAVSRLVEAGILKEVTGRRRNRLFRAHDVMRIVNRPFGSEPVLPGDSV